MRPASSGLRTRVMLLVLFAVIPAIGLMAHNAVFQRQEAARRAQHEAMNLARLAAQQQGQMVTATHQLLQSLALLPEMRDPRKSETCHRILADLLKLHPHYSNLGVAAPNGRVFCSALSLDKSVTITDRDYFRDAMESGDFAVGTYQIGRITGVSSINFGHPILDASGKSRSVIFVALNLSWLNQLVARADLPPGSTLTVVDSRGTILARHPDSAKWVGKSMPDSPLVKAMTGHGGEGTTEAVGMDGRERLYAFAPLYSSPSGNAAHVGIGMTKDAVFAAVHREFVRDLSLLVLVAALALAAAWAGSNRFVLRRVQTLTDAARRFGQGDLSARTGLPHGDKDIGRLARSFDEMAGALETRTRQIEQAQRELQRVNRALKTLSAGNRTLLNATEEQKLLEEMCRVAVEVGGYRMACVTYARRDEQKSILPMASVGAERDYLEHLNLTWADTKRGRGPIGSAIRTGKPQMAHDIHTDPRFAPWREEALKRGYASVIALPLRFDNELGALAVYAAEPDAFGEEEIKLFAEMADDLSFGIATIRARIKQQQADAYIRHIAYHDVLTGLPNRAWFEDHVWAAIAETQAASATFAILMLRVERLHEITNTLGHRHGEILLKQAGPRLLSVLPEGAGLAALEAGKFAVLLPGADASRATATVQRLVQSLQPPFDLEGVSVEIGVAAGIALFPGHGDDTVILCRRAEVALQQSRRIQSGYAVYSPKSDPYHPKRLALMTDLRRAIEGGQLFLLYQPKIDLRAARVSGVEALVRWRHPVHGLIAPDEFIGLAERTGLIRQLTQWVIGEALRQNREWRRHGLCLAIAVNLSTRDLLDPGFLESLKAHMATWGAEPEWTEFEITESTLMGDPERALEVLTRLDTLCAAIYIDDFGTGYSSLSYLRKLPVDAIKVDKSFVMDMTASQDAARIVHSTIDLAHDLGLKVVAEGVENETVLGLLGKLGCDAVQGFHIGKPMPEGEFREWLRQSPWTTRKTRQAG